MTKLLIRTLNQLDLDQETKNGLPPFRRILSAIGTPIYKLAQFSLPFLTPLTQNKYTVTDTFHFAEEICKQDPNLYKVQILIPYLLTFNWTKLLIFALIVCVRMMRIA